MPKALRETTPLGEAKVGPSGRMRVHAITAGLGSSGYYSPEVIREAATNKLIDKGTPLFLDHPTETDRMDRPERSVRDIAAVFTEAATYDDKAEALVGEIQVFAPYRDLLTEMAPHIGLSITGSATDVSEGEVEGKRVPVIEGLAKIDSVDWVTKAGRGGKVVELLESVRVNKRALAHGVSEATVNDTREALQQVLRDAYGGDKVYVWVRDFDDTTVWFEVETGDGSGIWGQSYTQGDAGAVALTGDRAEVRVVTTYVPVNPTRPGDITTTQESKEDTMPEIKIEESAHKQLLEQAGRVPTLESERDTEKARADKAEAALAERDRGDAARKVIAEKATAAGVTFTALEERGLLADLPTTESGELDAEAFGKAVDEQVIEAAKRGSGSGVHGFGASATTTGVGESRRPTTSPWGRSLTEKGA